VQRGKDLWYTLELDQSHAFVLLVDVLEADCRGRRCLGTAPGLLHRPGPILLLLLLRWRVWWRVWCLAIRLVLLRGGCCRGTLAAEGN
jgi:hypothetical protein